MGMGCCRGSRYFYCCRTIVYSGVSTGGTARGPCSSFGGGKRRRQGGLCCSITAVWRSWRNEGRRKISDSCSYRRRGWSGRSAFSFRCSGWSASALRRRTAAGRLPGGWTDFGGHFRSRPIVYHLAYESGVILAMLGNYSGECFFKCQATV